MTKFSATWTSMCMMIVDNIVHNFIHSFCFVKLERIRFLSSAEHDAMCFTFHYFSCLEAEIYVFRLLFFEYFVNSIEAICKREREKTKWFII